MKNLLFKAFISLLTFAIGIFFALSLSGYNSEYNSVTKIRCATIRGSSNPVETGSNDSIDARLAASLRAMYAAGTNKACKAQSLSSEGCDNLKERFSKRDADRVASDMANADLQCKMENLSKAACALRKESVILEIQETILNNHHDE